MHLASRAYVRKVVERLMQEAIEKLNDHVIDISEQTVVDALKTCGVDRNKAFIKGALRKASNELLASFFSWFIRYWKTFGKCSNSSGNRTKAISDNRFSSCKRYHCHGTYCSVCCHYCKDISGGISEETGYYFTHLFPIWLVFIFGQGSKIGKDKSPEKKSSCQKSSVFSSIKEM